MEKTLLDQLIAHHSKENAQALAAWVGEDPDRFAEVWKEMREGKPPLPQRLAWVVDFITQEYPEQGLPFRKEAIELLQRPYHNAVHRALSKMLSKLPIDEEEDGRLYDLCLSYIGNPRIHVAIQVHCMEIAWNIAKPYPELCQELWKVIDAHWEEGSAGYQARGRRIRKKMEKVEGFTIGN